MNEYVDALERVEAAQKPSELFDVLGGNEPNIEYRRLAKLLHPDRHPDDTDRAHKGFARLSELWSLYGTEAPLSETFTVSTKRHAYVVRRAPAWQGDLASLYLCEHYEDSTVIPGIMKIPRSPKNNDLMKNEALTLKHIAVEGDANFAAYVPQHLETFRHRDVIDKKERLVNVLDMPEGLYSLQEVHNAFPNGVGPKDIAWMWRRLLVALGYIHSTGRVHGALTPDHILIHPEKHGLVLVDWCYSVEVGSPLQAIVPKHRALYPPGVVAKEDVTESLDIKMATQSLLYILKGRVPRQYKGFAQYSASAGLDGFGLKEEFDQLIGEMFGPRRFIPFQMPMTTRS